MKSREMGDIATDGRERKIKAAETADVTCTTLNLLSVGHVSKSPRRHAMDACVVCVEVMEFADHG